MRKLVTLALWLIALLAALGMNVLFQDATGLLVVLGLGAMIAITTLNDLTKKD